MNSSVDSIFSFVLANAAKHWRKITYGSILLIITNAIAILIPISIRQIVNKLISLDSEWEGELLALVGWAALLTLTMAIMRIGSRLTLFGFGRSVEAEQKQSFFEHLLKLDLSFFGEQRIGDLISRATSDIQAIRLMMGFGVLNIINIICVYCFTLPLMVNLNAELTLVTMISYLPLLYGVYLLSLKLKSQQQSTQEQLGTLSSFIEENLNGIQVVKSYSQELREIGRFNQINDTYLKVSTELAQWRSIIWPMMGLARGLGFFILFGYTVFGKLEPGAAAAYLVCLDRLVFPVAITGWLITILQRGAVSVNRLNEIYRAQPQIIENNLSSLEVKKGVVNVRNLTFAYEGGVQALQGASIDLQPGEFVGIVGQIGSGKSTLALALGRLINIPSGHILIDGQDITAHSLLSLRQTLALVPQETTLFNASIAENIGFGGDYTPEQIEFAAELANIHSEIKNLPQGYDTPVGERGVSLSGGQAQRIAIARALIGKPRIIVLDDALASVDNEIASGILQNIRAEFKDRTLVLITHRLSSLTEAERIYIMEQGKIVGSGRHDELLQTNEYYRKLHLEEKLQS